jgi:hypothetical protein
MTPAELDDRLDAMAQEGASDPNKLPGLITIHTDDWVAAFDAVRAPCKNLADGMRYRDIVVHVGSQKVTAVVARGEASGRGAPYRDLMPRP